MMIKEIKNLYIVIFSLLFSFFSIVEINAQLLKKLQDKKLKLSSKVAGKMLKSMPGGKMVENSANDIREYEDLNYHYKCQNDSLLFFLTFNHKLGIKGDVVLSIRNVSEKQIILDNIDYKKDKEGVYDKTFNSLREIRLSEINLINNSYQFLSSKKDIMDEYYENMNGVFNKRVEYFKGEALSIKEKMFYSLKPTDEFIERNSEVFLILDSKVTANAKPQLNFNPVNLSINLSSKSTDANLFDSNQVDIEYLISAINFRNYFDFISIIDRVLSANQTKIVDRIIASKKEDGVLKKILLLGEAENLDVFRFKNALISDFTYYLKYPREYKVDEFGEISRIPINFISDYDFNYPEKITLKLREDTSITLTKNPDWNETWRMDNGDFAAEKFKFLQQKRVDRMKNKKDKKKKDKKKKDKKKKDKKKKKD